MTARNITKQLIARYAKENLDYGIERLKEASQCCCRYSGCPHRRQPDKSLDIVRSALERSETDIQIRSVLQKAGTYKSQRRNLHAARLPTEVRLRILQIIERLTIVTLIPHFSKDKRQRCFKEAEQC